MKLRAWLVQGRAVLLAAAIFGIGWLTACSGGGGKESSSEKKSEQGAVSGKSGKLTDERDGQKYRTVKIGNQVWMAENLNHETGNSWCYDNDDSNCKQYGRLYDWETARTACPTGWHLPSRTDWDGLGQTVGAVREPDEDGSIHWKGASKKLKSTSGWNENGNGTDDFGFSAQPGGSRGNDGGSFNGAGSYGSWWTATEDGSSEAYNRGIGENVSEYYYDKGDGMSVRCVGD